MSPSMNIFALVVLVAVCGLKVASMGINPEANVAECEKETGCESKPAFAKIQEGKCKELTPVETKFLACALKKMEAMDGDHIKKTKIPMACLMLQAPKVFKKCAEDVRGKTDEEVAMGACICYATHIANKH